MKFGPPKTIPRLAFCTDSQVNAAWLNGEAAAKVPGYRNLTSYLHKLLAETQRKGCIRTSWMGADWANWVKRSMSQEADSLANQCLDEDSGVVSVFPAAFEKWPWIMVSSDGASRGKPGESAMGWVAHGSSGNSKECTPLVKAGLRLGSGSSTKAEAAAMAHAIFSTMKLAQQKLTEDPVKVYPMLIP